MLFSPTNLLKPKFLVTSCSSLIINNIAQIYLMESKDLKSIFQKQ